MSALRQKPEADWISTVDQLPPQKEIVWTMDSSGHVQPLMMDGRLWWFPDHALYVYYEPKFWKPMDRIR